VQVEGCLDFTKSKIGTEDIKINDRIMLSKTFALRQIQKVGDEEESEEFVLSQTNHEVKNLVNSFRLGVM